MNHFKDKVEEEAMENITVEVTEDDAIYFGASGFFVARDSNGPVEDGPKKCSCSINDIMIRGCTCGGY